MKKHAERVKMEEYIRTKKVRQLFQSLAVGLAKHRPTDELCYLQQCLDTVAKIGWQNVELDTFLNGASDASDSAVTKPTEGPVDKVTENVKSRWQKLICGCLENLPPMPSNIVRIFISSTFSDFKAERNELLRSAFPSLQLYCAQQGLDFQVVDLRWGVTDEVINDHQVSALCLREIAACQRLSVGPNFVALVGDRYGYRPFPRCIDAAEFETLMSVKGLTVSDVGTLTQWYQRDDNATSPCYLLQPLASKLPHIHEMGDKYTEGRMRQVEEWTRVSETIQRTLRQAAKTAVDLRLVDALHADKYFISVTETEIRQGVMNANADLTACCVRSLLGITQSSSDLSFVKKFLDLTPDGQADEDAGGLLRKMKSCLEERLTPENVLCYETRWNGQPLEEDLDFYRPYLDRFCANFVDRMKAMVDEGLRKRAESFLYSSGQDLGVEVLHHATMAVVKSQIFCGREDILRRIQTYVQSSEPRSPLVLHGLSGQGKTAVMAVAAQRVFRWIPANAHPVVVLRFLGTTASSSDILSVLRSVIAQLALALDLPVSEKLEQMSQVRKAFSALLQRVGKKRTHSRVVIVFDSVDQLLKTYGGHRMMWLPRSLPKNVYILVSMLSVDVHDCLINTVNRVRDGDCVVELKPLADDVMNDVVQLYLAAAERRVTRHQLQLVHTAVSSCRQPLFIKLVLDQAAKWTSYAEITADDLPTSIHDAISRLFANVEGRYGLLFVSHALAYLTCSRGGLSGIEMEDVLSCDDEVLDEVYRYHDPPLHGTVRIPSLMWARITEDLREYLAERQVDGKTVLSWYHRQFLETAERRYLDSDDRLKSFHFQLAEIYNQETGLRRSITLHQRRGIVLEDADRKVTPQPLTATNLRKLKCLPYHLLRGQAAEQIKDRCLVNFQWLLTWLRAEGINTVLNEYRFITEDEVLDKDLDVELVSGFFQLCYDSLYYSPELFAYHVSERIPAAQQSPSVCRFVYEAAEHIRSSSAPCMLPTHSMKFPSITGPLRLAVMVGQDGSLSADGSKVVCTWTGAFSSDLRIQVMSLSTFEVLASVPLTRPSPVVMTRDSQYFVMMSGRSVRICEADTGDIYRELRHWPDTADNQITPRCLAVSHNGCYLAAGIRLAGRPDTDQPRTCSVVTLFSLSSLDDVLAEQTIAGRKVIASMVFTSDDCRLVVISISCITVLSVPLLDVLHQFHVDTPRIFASTLFIVPQSTLIVLGASVPRGSKALLFNTEDFSSQWTPLAPFNETDTGADDDVELIPFGVSRTSDPVTLVFGTRIKETKAKIGCGHLWLWDGQSDHWTATVSLGIGLWKFPCVLLVLSSRRRAVIGWSNGDLSVVDLSGASEIWNMHAHVHAINVLTLCQSDEALLTLAADNYLKLWSVDRLMKTADSHAHRKLSLVPTCPSPSQQQQLTGDANDSSLTTYDHEAPNSTADASGVDLVDVETSSRSLKQVKSINDEKTKPSTSNKSVSSRLADRNKATERVLDGFPRRYFREASFVGCPMKNSELTVEDASQKVQLETNSALSDTLSTLRGKNVEDDDDAAVISAAEQCVDVTVFSHYLVIASHINEEGPKFWHLHNGVLDVELTENVDAEYKKSLAEQNITFGGRNHAQLFCFDEFLVYVRKRSTSTTPCVFQISASNPPSVSVFGHIHLPDSYFSVFLPERDCPTGPFSMYVVREGVLEQRGADIRLLRSIEVPKLTEDIPNLLSSAGKKKLLSYTVAVTEDRRYFVIACPMVGGKSGRYVDVVDLRENRYLQRAALDPRFVWRVLEDGVYYVMVRPAGTDSFELVSVRTAADGPQSYDYCCITQSDLQITSPDGQYGVELTPDHSIHVWKTVSTAGSLDQNVEKRSPAPEEMPSDQTASSTNHSAPTISQNAPTPDQFAPSPEHCCVLSGHVAEVTCVSWASTDSRLLVSGSRDNTVRLWSLVDTGCQLCLFHVLGTIDNVHFDATSRYVAVHCSYAPQRKRAIVLRITNV